MLSQADGMNRAQLVGRDAHDTAGGTIAFKRGSHRVVRVVEMVLVADKQKIRLSGNMSITWAMIGFPSMGISGLGSE